jgi:hypothetical protein
MRSRRKADETLSAPQQLEGAMAAFIGTNARGGFAPATDGAGRLPNGGDCVKPNFAGPDYLDLTPFLQG